MSLFDRLRRLVAGGDENGAAPPDGGRYGGGRAHMQSHGSHWDTLLSDENREARLQELVMETVGEGEVIEGRPGGEREVTGHLYRDGPLGSLAVTLGGEIATAYPIGRGVEHDLTLERLDEWETGVEAWLGGSLREASADLFASNFFECPREAFGGDRTVSLSLMMYDFGTADDDTVVDESGEELDVSGMAGFRPYEQGAPDDYVVRTTVEAVETVSHAGLDAYRLRAPLFRTEDGTDVDVALYVADHVAGEYEPQVGDDVEGACWLQGWFE